MVILDKTEVYKGHLLLVNQEHPLREHNTYHPIRLVPVNLEQNDILLEATTATLLSQLLQSIGGNNEIIPISGYRTRQEQEKIFNDSLLENGSTFTKQYVALPDQSEHQTGLAIDLGKYSEEIDFLRPEFIYTGICGEFRKKAAKYGFVERYGKGKETITGISHEPWHFRYVGYPHAQIMQDNRLCLEEYIAYIKAYPYEGKHLHIKENTKDIEVFYVSADLDKMPIELPENDSYQVSGNNVDGFIITLWRW
jgi:D-alanyl-D-alanine dipeptidase/carboxypeptidase